MENLIKTTIEAGIIDRYRLMQVASNNGILGYDNQMEFADRVITAYYE